MLRDHSATAKWSTVVKPQGSGVRLSWEEVGFQTLSLPLKSCVTLI